MVRKTHEKFDVLVLGAGIIGTATAWHLQRRGKKTALLDRGEPGRGTSYGNAGLIERSSVVPYHFPRRLCDVLRYAGNQQTAVRYDRAYLPKIAPWLYQFWRHSSPKKLALATRDMLGLIERSVSEHAIMIDASGLQHLRREQGWIEIFRDKNIFNQAKRQRDQLAPYQLKAEILDTHMLQKREPALTAPLAGAIHWLDPHTIRAPDALVFGFCQNFIAQGGAFVYGDAMSLQSQEGGWLVSSTSTGISILADHVVIALGWESAALLKKLTKKSIPLAVKRGYHMHYAQKEGKELNHSLCDTQAGFVLAPMNRGLRLTTGIEFADPSSPANDIQLRRAEKIAWHYCDLGEPIDETIWLGRRPCLPDMRPVIGAVGDGFAGLWVNFGHAHHGLTLGPVSARLLTQMMLGEETFTNPEPFSIKRFNSRI